MKRRELMLLLCGAAFLYAPIGHTQEHGRIYRLPSETSPLLPVLYDHPVFTLPAAIDGMLRHAGKPHVRGSPAALEGAKQAEWRCSGGWNSVQPHDGLRLRL